MSDDLTQQKKWGLARLVSLIATALLFFSFFLPWFAWSWSCTGSDCHAVTLSLKTNPPMSSGFSVASNGVSLVSASASAPLGDRAGIAVSIDNFSTWSFWWPLISIALLLPRALMNLFKTSERAFHTHQPTQESAQPPLVPDTDVVAPKLQKSLLTYLRTHRGDTPDSSLSPTTPWKKWGLARLFALIAFFCFLFVSSTRRIWNTPESFGLIVTFFFLFFVASNGFSLVATSAPVGDRAVLAVSTASFRFPWLWLVLVISMVLFLLHLLMNLFKIGARWEPPLTLMITAVALVVEIFYLASAFGGITSISNSTNGYVDGSFSLHATLTTSYPLVDATLHLAHGPSFGFWLGLCATLVVGGVAIARRDDNRYGNRMMVWVRATVGRVFPSPFATTLRQVGSLLMSKNSALPPMFSGMPASHPSEQKPRRVLTQEG